MALKTKRNECAYLTLWPAGLLCAVSTVPLCSRFNGFLGDFCLVFKFYFFIFSGCAGSSLLHAGFSPVAVIGVALYLQCTGSSLLLLLGSMGMRAFRL